MKPARKSANSSAKEQKTPTSKNASSQKPNSASKLPKSPLKPKVKAVKIVPQKQPVSILKPKPVVLTALKAAKSADYLGLVEPTT